MIDFKSKPVIGMIHLGGDNPVPAAIREMALMEKAGLDAVLIENYFGSVQDVRDTLYNLDTSNSKLKYGVNILPNNFEEAYRLANLHNLDFLQLDYVSGNYEGVNFDSSKYLTLRKSNPDISVIGGVWPKYYTPVVGSNFENDLRNGMTLVDAIGITGTATGSKTPLGKINSARSVLGSFPLVVAAGITLDNISTHFTSSDGCIIGSYLKEGGVARNDLDYSRTKSLMTEIRRYRDH